MERKTGLIFRVYSKAQGDLSENLEEISDILKTLEDLRLLTGRLFFSRIDILIPTNPIFLDCDYGETREYILRLLNSRSNPISFDLRNSIFVRESKLDFNSGMLNSAIRDQVVLGIFQSVIMSTKARRFLTLWNLQIMLKALEAGAKVSGLAIGDLAEMTLNGRIQNTFAMWDGPALVSVGGFPRSARSRYANEREEDQPISGEEEIVPLLLLARSFEDCIAPIVPQAEALWRKPDPRTDPEDYSRYRSMIEAREIKQLLHAESIGGSLEELKKAVIFWQ